MKLREGRRFAQKHGANAKPDTLIEAEILKRTQNKELPCAVAFKIAEDLKISADQVGITADLIDFRLTKCQLGLFGYQPNKKIVTPKSPENPDLETAIIEAGISGKLACKNAWEIALRFSVRKMVVSRACEALKVKIKPCQLGAF